jgi:tRNA pseudouridine38-40 synthase
MRYKITIRYDGSYFSGWQLQKNQSTVQGLLEKILKKISKAPDRIIVFGSSRTDTGVHAFGQVAHVDLSVKLNNQKIKDALNGNLPWYCEVSEVKKVKLDFNARYNATSREYIYQCYTGKSFLFHNQSWILPVLDIKFLNKLSCHLLGNYDFLSFSKFRKDLKNTNCNIFSAYWEKDKDMYTFHIKANRYLHHMIRYIVGSMIGVYQNRISEKEFILLIKNPRKNVLIFKAPPQGLILNKVNYD